jgi:hypothetical protein
MRPLLFVGLMASCQSAPNPQKATPPHRAVSMTCAANSGTVMVCATTEQAKDACLTDGDCGMNMVCQCYTPIATGCGQPALLGNFCVTGNCRVDADCGQDGFCVPQIVCGSVSGYYCQTAADACEQNADCQDAGQGEQCIHQGSSRQCVAVGCPG